MYYLSDEECDRIIIDSLRDSYDRTNKLGYNESSKVFNPDYKLLDAIETLMRYYMCPTEFKAWNEYIKETKQWKT